MKICILSSVHEALDNRIFYKEAKTLAAAGHDVVLVAQHPKNETIDGVRIIALPKPKSRTERFLKLDFLAYKTAVMQKAAAYHFHDPELMPFGIALKFFFGAKVIYDAHEDTPRDILVKNWINGTVLRKLISVIFEQFEKFACIFFDKVIIVTAPMARNFPAAKTVVIQNLPVLDIIDGIASVKTRALKDVKKTKPVIIYSGGLNKVRGIKEIIRAVGLLKRRAELWLIGDWKDKDFEQECRGLDDWQHVKYLGYKDQSELYVYIKNADIGIINFLPMVHNVYALPNKPFEYMACGLPVIMSNFPYWKDIFKDSVVFTNPADPADIAAKIGSLLDNSEKMKELGKNGRKLVLEKFNWENEGKKLLALYNDLKD